MSDSNPPPNDALTAATQMVKNGRLEQARETLMQYLMQNPSSEQAWLLMSYVLSDPAKQKDCLERVLRINPNNTVAQSKLAHLLGRRTEELFQRKAAPPAPPAPAPEAAPEPAPEPAPVAAAVPEPAPPGEKREAAIPGAASPEPPAAPEEVAAPAKKPASSGKWFRIVTILLLILILIIVAVIVYTGIIGPAINSLSSTPTPTAEPVIILTLPPEWTQTLTPTLSPTLPPAGTPAP